MHARPILVLISSLFALTSCGTGFQLPNRSSQCIVGIADDWNDSHATIHRFQKSNGTWHPVGSPIPARLGKSGLAWGLGLHPVPTGTPLKKEGDWKAPAGVFEIGGVWGYAQDITRHPKVPYRRVTPRDLWVEDSTHRHYNQHLILPHDPSNDWEKKQQMKQSDPAHALKLFIAHNAPPKTAPGMGSSIFFHIWRANGTKPTAGCTTMSASHLQQLIAWLDPDRHPLYVLLPSAEYKALASPWHLPPLPAKP